MFEKVLDKEWDIFDPLAQGRNAELDHLEPIEQILTETTRLDPLSEVAVGRRNEAKIDLDLSRPADPHDVTLLEHPQEFDLQIGGKLRNLVEEQGPARGAFDQTDTALVRTRECALFVSKKLGLENLSGNSAAVDGHERPAGAR